MNIHADGTFIASDTSDFGGLSGRLESPIYGVWRQTGPRESLVRFLVFTYDRNGAHMITMRVTGVQTFDEDFRSWHAASAIAESFAPEHDPTDSNASPFATHTIPRIAARRLALPSQWQAP
jgi:hypothetical protein